MVSSRVDEVISDETFNVEYSVNHVAFRRVKCSELTLRSNWNSGTRQNYFWIIDGRVGALRPEHPEHDYLAITLKAMSLPEEHPHPEQEKRTRTPAAAR